MDRRVFPAGRCAAGVALLALVACEVPVSRLTGDPDSGATDDGRDAATDDDRADPPDGALDTDVTPPPHDRPVPAVAGSSRATGSLWAHAERTTRRPLFRWHSPEDDGGGPWLYEIQVDDSCAPGSGSSCVFPSPEAQASGIAGASWQPADDLAVSETPPVGRSYGWRVRGCRSSSCTAWSLVAFVGVGRVAKDFDGDGYSDVAVGGDGRTAETAIDRAVYVFRGGAAGIEPTPYVVLENPLHPGIFDAFAWDLAAAGDVDADGFSDLLVPAYGPDRGYLDPPTLGWVYLYRGGPGGLRPVPDVVLADPGAQPGSFFGMSSKSAGDLDADGYDDVVIGAGHADGAVEGAGKVFVYRGGPIGIEPEPTTILENPPGSQGEFGNVVAGAGDVDGDGYGDLAASTMGVPGADYGEGAVYVFYGCPVGVETTALTAVRNPRLNLGWLYGNLAIEGMGDIDGDGYEDLAVDGFLNDLGAPGDAGVYLYRGSQAGLGIEPYTSLFNPDGRVSAMTSCRLAVDDLDGNGLSDLLVALPLGPIGWTGSGIVFLYSAGVGRFPISPGLILSSPTPEDAAHFGEDVAAAGDVNGDGYPEVVVGCGDCATTALSPGAAVIFFGGAEGITPSSSAVLENPIPRLDAAFGMSVE
ncbi:MAG: FG-GAP repeat protein [Deltaproteobacteria bacterium]|nr:FG-GAP repeat protein [Deltaproteobacteria bacterium]